MTEPIVYCRPEPFDEMTRSLLFIAACRTRIHVHETEPCQQCLGDMLGLGAYAFAMLTLINRQEEQLAAGRMEVEVTNSAAKILADDLKRANARVAELEEAAHEPQPCEMCQAMEETVAAADAERDRLERELAEARQEIDRLRAVPEVRGRAAR